MTPTVLVQPVHFEDFDGKNFERLVLSYLVNTYTDCKFNWYGVVGKDEGRDIWGESKTGRKYCYQCTKSTLTFQKIQKDIDKICKSKKGVPDNLIVVSGGDLSAYLQEKIEKYAHDLKIQNVLCWSGSQFEEYLRKDHEILLKRFCRGEVFPDHPRELKFLMNEPDPKPEDIKETLMANLIPVKKIPVKIYSASTDKDIGGKIFNEISNPPPFFIIPFEDRLYNFQQFNQENPLSPYVEISSQNEVNLEEWKKTNDGKKRISRLVNSWCRWSCFRAGLSRDDRSQRYYYKSPEGKTLVKRWRGGKKAGKRQVVKRYEKKNGEIYCIAHQAVRLSAFWFNNQIYLSILPEWVFTLDGYTPVAGPTHTKFERKFRSSKMTRNSAYRLHMQFWYEMILKDFRQRIGGLDGWLHLAPYVNTQFLEIGHHYKISIEKGIDEKKLHFKEEEKDENDYLPTIGELLSEEYDEEEEEIVEEEEDDE